MYLILKTQTLVLNMCYRSGFYQYIGICQSQFILLLVTFCAFLSGYEYNFRRGLRGLHGLMAALSHYITGKESV